MFNSNVILKKYSNQNYYVLFNKKTGFFIRAEEKGYNEPFFARDGAELLDISITNWCDRGCENCYRNSNENGKHISLKDYENIIKQASENNLFQVALGGGNPNQHSSFIEILKLTREKYNIVPSYTTNGRGLTKDILQATKKYCGAIAVSAYYPYNEMIQAINILKEYEIKTNIHFVLDSNSINEAIHWFKNTPKFFNEINAIIFLNYKPIGKNKNYNLLLKNSNKLKEFFELIENQKYSFKIGFDSCMVSGILSYMNKIDLNYLEACEAGRFSAFISEDLKMYPCSFMIESYQGESLKEKSYIDIWQNSDLFKSFREKFNNKINCMSCELHKNCLGGCNFLNEINLCNIK